MFILTVTQISTILTFALIGSHADIAAGGAAAKLIGLITKGTLIVNKKQVDKSSSPTQMTVIGNIDR